MLTITHPSAQRVRLIDFFFKAQKESVSLHGLCIFVVGSRLPLHIDNKESAHALGFIYTQGYILLPRGSVPHHSIMQSELSRFTTMERSQTLPNYVCQVPVKAI